MDRDDTQLIDAYLEGDEQALEALVDRHLAHVRNFILRLVGDKPAAEDIAQESFIKAWKNIRGFRTSQNFSAWLFTIAHNTAIDHLRRKKEIALSSFEDPEGNNILLETLADRAPRPDELLAHAENIHYVAALLDELGPRYHEVLTLRYEKDLTFAAIGALLRRPLHTVKSQHRRALAALRRLVETQSF